MRTETRLSGGDFNWPETMTEVEVCLDDGLATKARKKWLLANGYKCDGRTVESVYQSWIVVRSDVFALPGITRERQEMEAVEYFDPYENGSNCPY